MGNIIVNKDKHYNIYSTISDRFIFESHLTLDQLTEYTKEEYGRKGVEELNERLVRVHKKGTSSYTDSDLKDTISSNACDNGSFMEIEDCIKKYL